MVLSHDGNLPGMAYKDPKRQEEWLAANKDRVREHKRKSAAKHPETSKKWQDKNPRKRCQAETKYRLRKLYGMTVEQYGSMLIAQDGRCGLCDGPFGEEKSLSPVVDHDHKTGKVRALLHHRCNVGIGALGDSSGLCEMATNYLRYHKS
jgi:hypothetical protein